jgi:hypothetical protein
VSNHGCPHWDGLECTKDEAIKNLEELLKELEKAERALAQIISLIQKIRKLLEETEK